MSDWREYLSWKYQDINAEFYRNLEDATGVKNLSSPNDVDPEPKFPEQPLMSAYDPQTSATSKAADETSKYHDFALTPSQHQMWLRDVDEYFYRSLSVNYEVVHLSAADSFPTTPFPVVGTIFGTEKRLAVPLNVQWDRSPKAPILRVWFVVMTGSNCSFINEETMRALTGSASGDDRPLSAIQTHLQEPCSIVQLYLSHGNFKNANVLGMADMSQLEVTIKAMNFHKNKWLLAKTPK